MAKSKIMRYVRNNMQEIKNIHTKYWEEKCQRKGPVGDSSAKQRMIMKRI
jgi:hypothetical protein